MVLFWVCIMGVNEERRRWMGNGWVIVGEIDVDEVCYFFEMDPFLRCLLVILILVSVK